MLGGPVGAPHVAGVGYLGGVCCVLMFLSSVSTDKLALFSKELWVAGKRSDAIESMSSGWHSRWGDSDTLLGAVRA